MPRRPRPNSDTNERTYLALPLEDVTAALNDRIAKGNNLQASVPDNVILVEHQLNDFSSRVRTWSDWNVTYLERAFTTTKIMDDYSQRVPIVFIGPETLAERKRDIKTDLQISINFLVSLVERLPLFVRPPDAPALQAPVSSGTGKFAARLPVGNSSAIETSELENWAKKNQAFVEIVFERFNNDAEWPQLPALQRALDRLDENLVEPQNLDVEAISRTMPVEYGIRDYSQQRVSLKVRSLATISTAIPLIEAFMRVVRLAVQRYLAEDGSPKLRSHDLTGELAMDGEIARRVAVLLDGEPLLLGGGTGMLTDVNWERDLAQSVRHFRNARDVGTYLAAQARVLAVPTGTPPVIPRRLFGSAAVGSTILGATPSAVHAQSGVTFALDDLHPTIREACESRFFSQHYGDGVHQAAIAFRDLVREASGLKALDGPDLMSQAFSPKTPAIVVGDLATKTGQSIQLGTMLLAQGAMVAYRNVVAHERTHLEPTDALAMVGLFSLLARRVESAVTVEESAPKSAE